MVKKYDLVGIASSVLCIVHCIAMPFALNWLHANPALGHIGGEWEHIVDFGFIGLCFWAVRHATLHSQIRFIKYLLWISFGLFALSILFAHHIAFFQYLGWFASAGLVFSHLLNLRLSNGQYPKV